MVFLLAVWSSLVQKEKILSLFHYNPGVRWPPAHHHNQPLKSVFQFLWIRTFHVLIYSIYFSPVWLCLDPALVPKARWFLLFSLDINQIWGKRGISLHTCWITSWISLGILIFLPPYLLDLGVCSYRLCFMLLFITSWPPHPPPVLGLLQILLLCLLAL